MEGIGKEEVIEFLKKYKYVLVVFLAGLALMMIPEKKITPTEIISKTDSVPETDFQSSLSDILSQIEGAGKVRVLLSEAKGDHTYYQTDEQVSKEPESMNQSLDTVTIMDQKREETGLVKRVDPPIYQGAIILCQGADSAAIRLAIVDAVAKATGLTSNHISVLKMK